MMTTPTPSTTKAMTIAELITSEHDREADQLLGDIVEQLTAEEIQAIFDALSARNERNKAVTDVDLMRLSMYGLPYIVHDDELFDATSFVSLLDATLVHMTPFKEGVDLSIGGEYSDEETFLYSEALYWPHRGNSDNLYTFTLWGEVWDEETTTVVITDAGTELRNISVALTYMRGTEFTRYASYRCDLVVRKNGTVERLGVPHSIHSEWYGGYVTD